MQRSTSIGQEVLPIREISDRHEGEWVLIKILDSTLPMGEAPAVVLAHGPDRKVMFKEERKARKREPTALLTVLPGGEIFGDGEALRQALAHPATLGEEFVSVNNW